MFVVPSVSFYLHNKNTEEYSNISTADNISLVKVTIIFVTVTFYFVCTLCIINLLT